MKAWNHPSRLHYALIIIQIAILSLFLLTGDDCAAEVKTNDLAPGITLRDMDNRLVMIKSVIRQKPVLVSFFFTACKPCKKEIPELEKLNEKYKNRIQMYLVATDKEGADALRPYIKSMNMTIPVLLDQYQDVVGAYGVTKYPSLYIIGRDGRVKYSCAGYDPANIARIEEIIQNKLR